MYKITGELDTAMLKQAGTAFIEQNKVVHAKYNHDCSECYFGNYTIDDFYD